CCGVAFQTNYLTLFPVGVIILWFFGGLWRLSRPIAVAAPIIAAAIGLIGFSTLLLQMGARPTQYAGRVGLTTEIRNILAMTPGVVWTPRFMTKYQISRFEELESLVPIYSGLMALMGTVIVRLMRGGPKVNRGLWLLLVGLASAPPAGLFLS